MNDIKKITFDDYDQNVTRVKKVDHGIIKIRENSNTYKRNKYTDLNIQKESKNDEFCYKMYNDWIRANNHVDIPVLIMDNENLMKNKDVDIIPRLYAKYIQKRINIPFLYHEKKNKYVSLNKYFRIYLNKDIPNIVDFKNFLIEKKDLHKNQDLYESINIFLYTSFLLKQFATVMKIVPYFYSPISDETKYYFYILFDYMRRDCIQKEVPLMKKDVIDLIKNLYSLDKKVLTNELFLNTFTFMNESIFDITNKFYLITLDKIFKFDISKEKIDSENIVDLLIMNNNFLPKKNKILFSNSFDILRIP